MARYKTLTFPKSRLATIDVCELSQKKHHVTGFIEIDVSEDRGKIKRYKREAGRISFTAWLVKANEKSIESITKQINDAQKEEMTEKDIILHTRSTGMERLYYHLPAFARRLAWRYMMKRPSLDSR